MESLSQKKKKNQEETLAQCLRNRAFLKRLERKEPIYEMRLSMSRYAQNAFVNRWYADEYGVVIHYPEAIYVSSKDYEEFHAIPLSEEDCKFDYSDGIRPTINLFVTRDLIAIEFRWDRYWGRANVYNRKTLEQVYNREKFPGQFYTGQINGIKELLLKETDETWTDRAIKINQCGEEVILWEGGAYCDCLEENRPPMVYLNEKSVLRFCYMCNTGNLENLETGVTTEEEFDFHHPRIFQKAAVRWFPESNIVAVEERAIHGDIQMSLGLVNIETGQTELAFETIAGDHFRCYAVSPKYLVVCYMNYLKLRPHFNDIFHIIVKNRYTGLKQEYQVPEFTESLSGLIIMAGSILVALPVGSTPPVPGVTYERIYTMDLDEEDPRASIMDFKVPISEVRPIGNDKIVCKITEKKADIFKVYSLS